MKIDILTLFPEMFPSVLNSSITGRAHDDGKVELNYVDIREFSGNKHNKVDDYSYGGGMGMLMKAQPIVEAIDSVKSDGARIIYLSPKGVVYNQELAIELSKEDHIVLLCGHYEGIDNRVVENYVTDEISIGDYVLTGGEIGAMVLADSVIRLLPGVLSDEDSFIIESHYHGLLEYPQYTRPREYGGYQVPELLLSGDHAKIEEWRLYESIKATYLKRPDMLENREFTDREKKIFEKVKKELRDSL